MPFRRVAANRFHVGYSRETRSPAVAYGSRYSLTHRPRHVVPSEVARYATRDRALDLQGPRHACLPPDRVPAEGNRYPAADRARRAGAAGALSPVHFWVAGLSRPARRRTRDGRALRGAHAWHVRPQVRGLCRVADLARVEAGVVGVPQARGPS